VFAQTPGRPTNIVIGMLDGLRQLVRPFSLRGLCPNHLRAESESFESTDRRLIIPGTPIRWSKRFESSSLHLYGLLAQLVSAPACHAGGHGFESHTVRHNVT
jgi:hypothetical protein